jgi:hypothetical protein
MEKAATGVEESKRKRRAGPRPAQLAAAGVAATALGQGAKTPSQIRVGPLRGGLAGCARSLLDIDTHAHYSVQLKYRHFYREQPSLAQNSSASTADQQDAAHVCQSTTPAHNFLVLTYGRPTFSRPPLKLHFRPAASNPSRACQNCRDSGGSCSIPP